MYFGVERNIALFNAGFLVIAVAGLSWWWWLLPSTTFHFVMRGINKKDPLTLKVYGQYRHFGWRYDPWPHLEQSSKTLRPVGYMRGQLC